ALLAVTRLTSNRTETSRSLRKRAPVLNSPEPTSPRRASLSCWYIGCRTRAVAIRARPPGLSGLVAKPLYHDGFRCPGKCAGSAGKNQGVERVQRPEVRDEQCDARVRRDLRSGSPQIGDPGPDRLLRRVVRALQDDGARARRGRPGLRRQTQGREGRRG